MTKSNLPATIAEAEAVDVVVSWIDKVAGARGRPGAVKRVEAPNPLKCIPGKKSAGRQLRRFEASEIHVLTPTVGEWNGRTLSDWSKDVEIPLKKVRLKWISTSHPWAKHDGWTLSTKVNAALGANGVRVEHIPNDERLTENHLDEDGRTLVPPNERGMIGTKVFSRGAFLER